MFRRFRHDREEVAVRRSFGNAWEMGEVARDWVIQQLNRDRWDVVPLDAIQGRNGHGPQTIGGRELILPDLQATKNRQSVSVEVKGKEAVTWGKIAKAWEHGIDAALLDDYRAYDRQFLPTFLVIVELGRDWNGRAAYAARVSELRPHLNRDLAGTLMAYWPREQMSADWLLRLNRNITQRGWRPPS
jgi:hypothetical protein